MKKVIGFDVDGVLADFIWGFTAQGRLMFGTPVTHTNQQKAWDHFEGLGHKEVGEIWTYIKSSTNFWRLLEACVSDHVFDEIARLNDEHDVYFITSRPGVQAKQQTEGWLSDRGIMNPTVIISSDKGYAVQAVKATHYIDDKAGNCVFAKYHNKHTDVFLLDRMYNRWDQTVIGSKVKRVNSVEEFLKEVTVG